MAKATKNTEKVLTQIRKLPAPYNTMGERLHELIGLTVTQDIPADTALTWEMVSASPATVGA